MFPIFLDKKYSAIEQLSAAFSFTIFTSLYKHPLQAYERRRGKGEN